MIKDLRTKTDLELGELITKLKVQLLETRFKIANGEVENTHLQKEIRKTIAKAMTVLSERNVKISFSTFDTQLIKQKGNKQEFITISRLEKEASAPNKDEASAKTKKVEKNEKEVATKKATDTKSTTSKSSAKKTETKAKKG